MKRESSECGADSKPSGLGDDSGGSSVAALDMDVNRTDVCCIVCQHNMSTSLMYVT